MTYPRIIGATVVALISKEAALLLVLGFITGLVISNLVKRVKARKEV